MLKIARTRTGWLPVHIWMWTGLIALLLVAGLLLRLRSNDHASRLTVNTAASSYNGDGGSLMIVGGGELPFRVQRQFVDMAGGAASHLVMITGVHVDETYVDEYMQDWQSYGPASVTILNASSRTEADSEEFSKPLDSATGVWLGGGQQTWLMSCYGGTRTEHKIRQLLERSGIVGGTSAGAAVMSEVMITGGRKKPSIGTGFGFLPGVVIDQHFIKRNRFSRLRHVVEQHPKLVGIGIDESTALVVSLASRKVRVVGDSYIVVCLPEKIGRQYRVDVDFYNPGDEFQLAPAGHPESMLARSSMIDSSLEQ